MSTGDRTPRRADGLPDLILEAPGLLDRHREAARRLDPTAPPAGSTPITTGAAPDLDATPVSRPTAPPGGRIAADGARLRAGELSAVELLGATLADLDRWEPSLRALTLDLRERALEEARGADRELAAGLDRGPLHGIPVAVKDLLHIAGLRTSAASALTVDHVATEDAAAVAALRSAGAVIVAKANTHEYAFGALTPPTRNPRDLRCMPGGSSGGSGALVGAGIVGAAVGTDTAGSVREPAALCGAVGLKPTAGLISNDGVVPLSWSLDTVGPIGMSVADTWHLLSGLGVGGVAPRVEPLPRSLGGVRVAVWGQTFHRLQAPVREGLERGMELLSDAGAHLVTVDLGEPDDLVAAALVLLGAEALAFHAHNLPGRRDEYQADVIAYLDLSATFSGVDVVDAQRIRRSFGRLVDHVLADHDVVLTPAQIVLPPGLEDLEVGLEDGRTAPRDLSLIRTLAPFNLSGHPALSLPVAEHPPSGHTVSVQLVAGHGRDRWLLGLGALLEEAVGPIPPPAGP